MYFALRAILVWMLKFLLKILDLNLNFIKLVERLVTTILNSAVLLIAWSFAQQLK